ncbi:MAG: glycoside hydrolase family 16 protein [Polyangiaceae bacterium]|nr:glycoside hydrolase family 16 protein [Polyangiaceae bacterium]
MIPPTPPRLRGASSQHRPRWRRARRGLAPLFVAAVGCGGPPQTSSSSHWLTCSQDSDCSNLEVGARCGDEGICLSAGGTRLVQTLVFSEEFDGTTLEGTRWAYEIGAGIRNNEAQAYTNRPENVKLESGHLVLTGRAEQYQGSSFTSGSVNTEGLFSFAFARVEARLAAPVGRGCSAAFWMLPENPTPNVQSCIGSSPCYSGTWPAWGDITIANLQSQLPGQVLGTISYGVWDDALGGVTHGVFAGENATVEDATAYHTYALEWGPVRVDWFVDDVKVRTVALPPEDMYLPGGVDPFHEPFHIRLNLALGGLDQAPDAAVYPQELRIDWVRVSQWQAED